MLQLTINDSTFFDERTETFFDLKGQTIQLEHSLVSISKWEAKWKKPFLSRDPKTREETIDYIRFMTITQCVNPLLYSLITNEMIDKVNAYIDDPMTATRFKKEEGKGNTGRSTTSEEIYYYMTAYQIPFEAQRWHLNRLMTLIRICDEKNRPKKKQRRGANRESWSKANAARRAKMGSKG